MNNSITISEFGGFIKMKSIFSFLFSISENNRNNNKDAWSSLAFSCIMLYCKVLTVFFAKQVQG